MVEICRNITRVPGCSDLPVIDLAVNRAVLSAFASIEIRVPNQFSDQIEDVHLIIRSLKPRAGCIHAPGFDAFSRSDLAMLTSFSQDRYDVLVPCNQE